MFVWFAFGVGFGCYGGFVSLGFWVAFGVFSGRCAEAGAKKAGRKKRGRPKSGGGKSTPRKMRITSNRCLSLSSFLYNPARSLFLQIRPPSHLSVYNSTIVGIRFRRPPVPALAPVRHCPYRSDFSSLLLFFRSRISRAPFFLDYIRLRCEIPAHHRPHVPV